MHVTAASYLILALVATLVLVIILRYAPGCHSCREGLVVSPEARQIARDARNVFEEFGGNPRYSAYKRRVLNADPVQFTRIREMHRRGAITPEGVQAVM